MAKGNHSFTEQDIHSRFNAIVGHTVAEVDTAGVLTASSASRNKGRVGAVIERSVLGYPADSDSRPDILIDGQPWEVKVTGLVEVARGGWRAKEPMSITAGARGHRGGELYNLGLLAQGRSASGRLLPLRAPWQGSGGRVRGFRVQGLRPPHGGRSTDAAWRRTGRSCEILSAQPSGAMSIPRCRTSPRSSTPTCSTSTPRPNGRTGRGSA